VVQGTAGRAKVEDPRYIRVRASLVGALLDLAAETPVEDISVSQLTTAAGVSRTTFYGHASSPTQLLADTLIAELRPQLEDIVEAMSHPGVDYVGQWRRLYRVLLEHVQHRARIYKTMLGSNSLALSFVLDFLEDVSTRNVDAVIAQFTGEQISPLWRTMAIQQQVRNTVAMIVAWLQTGMTDPITTVIDTYLTLAPPWQLARPDAAGQIAMRRIRSTKVSAPNSAQLHR